MNTRMIAEATSKRRKAKRKNGVINRKILFSDKGLDFIGKIAPAVNILKF